ncbi:MAG: D-sedoheptulose 7-phosphate isomerase [Bacteroidales bacterium]
MQNLFRTEFIESQQVFEKFLSQPSLFDVLEQTCKTIVSAIQSGGKIITCGNGGSMTDAMHFAEELTGKFRNHRKSIPAIAISDVSHISCVANDYGYEYVFSRYVESVAQSTDVLFAISTSGTSANIIQALKSARSKGMKTVLLTGNPESDILKNADFAITVPHIGYADRIQEIHIKIIHALIHGIEHELHIN